MPLPARLAVAVLRTLGPLNFCSDPAAGPFGQLLGRLVSSSRETVHGAQLLEKGSAISAAEKMQSHGPSFDGRKFLVARLGQQLVRLLAPERQQQFGGTPHRHVNDSQTNDAADSYAAQDELGALALRD